MMNIPTNSADVGEHVQEGAEEAEALLEVGLAVGRVLPRGDHLVGVGAPQIRCDAGRQGVVGDRLSEADETLS
jgi:hypothetical protein